MLAEMTEFQPRDVELQFAIKQLFAAYPNTPVSAEMLATYEEDLDGLENIQILKEALRNLRRSKVDFIPSIADIYEEYGRLKFSENAKKESRQRKLLESKTVPVPENEQQAMLAAINHNIQKRKAKEVPLVEALRIARLKDDREGMRLIREELNAIKEDHQLIADQIIAEFEAGMQISYLKEIAPNIAQMPSKPKRGQGWSSIADVEITQERLKSL